MSKLYTEQENTWAAMISNCKITNLQIQWAKDMIQEQLRAEGREAEYDPNYIPTFAQIVAACEKEEYELWFREPTEGEKAFFARAEKEAYGNWKIVGIYDDNDNSGMYAVAIETGEYTRNGVENGVILSTRGTEPTTWQQKYLDLANADLNIINSDVTEQEQVLYGFIDNQFAQLLAEKGYSNLATVGHSLGGYLAFSAAAHIATDTNSYAYKIFMQGTNIDGPGVTKENLADPVNQTIYAMINDRLTHYHYTYIGGLLTPICDNYISLYGASDIENDAKTLSLEAYMFISNWIGRETADDINAIGEELSELTARHALVSLHFNEDGTFDTDGEWITDKNIDGYKINLTEFADHIKLNGIFPVAFRMLVAQIATIVVLDAEGTEYDVFAQLANKATDYIDDNDWLQNLLGGLVKTLTDCVNEACELEPEYNQIMTDLESMSGSLKTIGIDFIKALYNPTAGTSQWFDLVSEVSELSKDTNSFIDESGEIIQNDVLPIITNVGKNLIGTIVATADELGLTDVVTETAYELQKEVMDCTQTLIQTVNDYNALGKYLEAQKEQTLLCESHIKELQRLSADFTDSKSELQVDFQRYSVSAMQFATMTVLYYSGNQNVISRDDLEKALNNVNDSMKKLLVDCNDVFTDGVDVIKEIGSTMKDYITNAFERSYAWGEVKVSEAILTVGNCLYENLKEVNVADLIENWFIKVDDEFNDATEYIYGLTGGTELKGSDRNDVIYGGSGKSNIYGQKGNDTLSGGKGIDYIEGNEGADKYCFNIGDGTDTVYDYEYNLANQNDRIVFGAGIKTSDVVMERNGDNLVVRYSDNDYFTVKDAYRYYSGTGRYFVENIEFADGTVWNTEEIANRANIQIGTEGNDSQNGYGEAVGYHQSETFHMLGGNDTVYAGEGNDTVYGEEGNDALYGENGNDTLIGGTGNDHMDGGVGADKYCFNIGDGTDTVYDYEYNLANQNDRIVFGAGIKTSDVVMERNGDNLVVWYSATDSFTVKDAYRYYSGTGRYFVESMEFADGTVWNTEEIANRANIQIGTEGNDSQNGYGEAVGYHQSETFHMLGGNDTVYAGEGNDTVYGEEGNDALYGENGNDTLIGGVGNDHMDGSAGADKYCFNIGDGTDTVYDYEYNLSNQNDRIVFGAGIKVEDVTMERNGDSLVVKYSATDSFTVKDAYRYYSGTGRYFVESMEFADGTVWNTEEIANRANIQIGTEGNDSQNGYGEAVGYHQSETFHMLGGNDTVNAGEGNDTVYGEEGNDALYGENGNDTLIGGAGNDYLSGGNGADTYFIGVDDGNDTINNYDSSATRQNDKIVFGEDISVDDISIIRSGGDLLITNARTEQTTVIAGAYNNEYNKLYNLEFYDEDKATIEFE